MEDFITPFWADLRAAIIAAWGGDGIATAGHPIFRVTQAEQRSWRALVQPPQDGDTPSLLSPWAAVAQGPFTRVPEYAAIMAYRVRPMIFFVTEASTPAARRDVAAYVEGRLLALEGALLVPRAGFQPDPDEPAMEYDVTETNPANAAFLAGNTPMFAGCLTVSLLCGFTPGNAVIEDPCAV